MRMLHRWLCATAVFLALAAPAAAQGRLEEKTLTTSGASCATSSATNCAMYDTSNLAVLGFYLDVGTSGTFVTEGSQDSTNGSNGTWSTAVDDAGDSSFTTDGQRFIPNKGYRWVRIRADAISGAAIVKPARGYLLPGAAGMVTVEAQPADDPHYVRCSDGSAANPCAVADDTLSTKLGEVQASPTANTVLDRLKDIVDQLIASAANDVAHDDADTGNPVKVGARAIAHGTNPTAVAAADRTNLYANRAGIPFVMAGHPNVISLESQVSDADGAQTDLALVTCGAGCKIVVTQAEAVCDEDTTADTALRLGFGTANVPAGAHTGTAGVVLAWDGIPSGSGKVRGTGAGIIGVGADGEDLRLTIGDPAGGSCNILVSYYTIES